MKVYPFIEAERAELPVLRCCRLLEVSRAAYHQWSKHVPSARLVSDGELTEKIKAIFVEANGSYGAPRVHAELGAQGMHCGKKRVARLMRQAGLIGRCRRRKRRTTLSDPETRAMDLIGRVFGPENLELDRAWVSDITYVRTWEGWMYLATVLDLASRRVVGWAMAAHMEASLVCDAVRMAIINRQPAPGLIFHSDRGSQYTSEEFRSLLGEQRMIQSLSRPRQCWDNAVAESWFATLKGELIYRHGWPTMVNARRAIFEFIEGWYNLRRRHSSLGYLSPAAYEHQLINKQPAIQAA